MKLEQLVAPLWFAKKLPKQVTALWWCIRDPEEPYVVPLNIVALSDDDDLKHYIPAPTMLEMEQLIGKYPLLNLADIANAFSREITHGGVTGKGWEYLDSLLFTKV